MTLDNEQQRKMLMEMFAASLFPGSALEHVLQLRNAIVTAEVAKEQPQSQQHLSQVA